jgi:hypothetical protein
MRSVKLVLIQLVRGGPTYLMLIVYGNFAFLWPYCIVTLAGPVFVTKNDPAGGGGGSTIEVVALALSPVETWTVFVTVAGASGAASTRTTIVEPAVCGPNCIEQVTVPGEPGDGVVGHVPFEIELTPMNLIPAGSGSVTVTSPVCVVPEYESVIV